MNRGSAFRACISLLVLFLYASVARSDQPTTRLAAPDAVTQANALRLVEDAHREEIGKAVTPEQKRLLAMTLMQSAAKSTGRPLEQFALYAKAKDIAAEAWDINTAFEAIDKLCEAFEVDAVTMKLDLLTAGRVC